MTKLKLASHGVTEEQMASAAWPVAVGKTIARRTTVAGLVRDRLVVQVEDKIWQRQLFALRAQILRRMEEALGKAVVQELEFRIAVPARKPAASEALPAAASAPGPLLAAAADEADGIRDPIFRSIYKAARRKATA